jgi:tetratricopeptide (TPR) repeat protein
MTRGEKGMMYRSTLKVFAVIAVIAVSTTLGLHTADAWAREGLKITIPRRSELSPVQRLNREGVEAIQKHQYEKASALFYKAYLYDPADPFTLNNLGYISELQSELDRAEMFYKLAAEQGSSAIIDRSNAKQLQGKPMLAAVNGLHDTTMRVNRMNQDAITLLSENRGFEAVALLKQVQLLDPENVFTMNNLGVAYESIGDYDTALKYYQSAAALHSSESVVVSLDRSWRGRPVSAMAAISATRLQARMRNTNAPELDAVMSELRGVAAANQNDWLDARQDFLHAYSIEPGNSFTLNNRGYVAEMDGDIESAQFFYDQARKAAGSNARVGLATQYSAEGRAVSAVAADSSRQVGGVLVDYSRARRQDTAVVELVHRDNAPSDSQATPDSLAPLAPSESPTPQPAPSTTQAPSSNSNPASSTLPAATPDVLPQPLL